MLRKAKNKYYQKGNPFKKATEVKVDAVQHGHPLDIKVELA